jgi:DNA-directed RNA polymerase specialized sigma24 family protein
VAGESICKAFVTAVLFSGSTERAEAAMLDGIASGVDGEELVGHTVTALLERDGVGESADAPASLPEGLRNVLRLPADLRRCFVLRVLMGWPRERCAELLRREAGEVDRAASLAAMELAEIEAS